uniref:Uncharacterized protein n=2 Tax=Babesia bovis TaxID=5865 RepID=A7AW77_BABBO|eukprot:XP_001608873.1 hypothetical protein [Babesia bovis T2Bo]
MERMDNTVLSSSDKGTSSPPVSRHVVHDRYECYTNDVSTPTNSNVARENKSRYKNVQIGPVMSANDVDALLSRKPNAVRNFINSLNEQMRHRVSPTGAMDTVSPVTPDDYVPEFDRELRECNVSVKSRINIFDRKNTVISRGARLMPVDSCTSADNQVDDIAADLSSDAGNPIDNISNSSTRFDYASETDANVPSWVVYNLKTGYLNGNTPDPSLGSNIPTLNSGRSNTDTVSFGGIPHNFGYPSRSISFGSHRPLYISQHSPHTAPNLSSATHDTDDSGVSNRSNSIHSLRQTSILGDARSGDIELPLELINRDCVPDASLQIPVAKSDISDVDDLYITLHSAGVDIRLRSVNVVKSGWTWMYNLKAGRWFPKFLVLFYDEPERPHNYQLHATIHDQYPTIHEDVEQETRFWDIYKIYSNMCRDAPSEYAPCPDDSTSSRFEQNPGHLWPNSASGNLTPDSSVLSKSCLQYYRDNDSVARLDNRHLGTVVIIPDGASVYLTIFDEMKVDIEGALRLGEFRELMAVDTTQVPYTKLYAPRNWLASLITRSIGKDPMYLIHIPLVNGYECVFMPLCAAQFSGVRLTYDMERALSTRVGREYEQWLFAIWEFVLRHGDITPGSTYADHCTTESRPMRVISIVKTWVRNAMDYIKSLWVTTPVLCIADNSSTSVDPAMDTLCQEQSYLRSVLVDGIATKSGVGTPEHKESVSKGFAQWIESRGFDDLSVSMNIYSITSRYANPDL